MPIVDNLAFYNGDPSVAHSARLLRMSLVSASYAGGVQVRSGILPAPAGEAGEVDVLTDTDLRVRPFFAVLQGARSSTQGAYVAVNDGDATLAIPPRDASLYRRALLTVRALDSEAAGVPADGSNNLAEVTLLPGALAASAVDSVLPVHGGDAAVDLGYVTVPPVGVGAVTFTPYLHKAVTRGGILVVDTTGDVDYAPVHRGAYRDHPTRGLERGTTGGAWEAVNPRTRHLGSDSGLDGATSPGVDTACVTMTVNVPEGLPATARLRYKGTAFIETGANVRPVIGFNGGVGERYIDRGSVLSDLTATYYSPDLTPGNRTVQLRVRPADAGGDRIVRWRASRLYVDIV